MKFRNFILAVGLLMSVLTFYSCTDPTEEDQELINQNETVVQETQASGTDYVDPDTVKPPTGG